MCDFDRRPDRNPGYIPDDEAILAAVYRDGALPMGPEALAKWLRAEYRPGVITREDTSQPIGTMALQGALSAAS